MWIGRLPGKAQIMNLWVRALVIGLCVSLVSACQNLAMPVGAEPIYVEARVDKTGRLQLVLCQRKDCKKGKRDLLESVANTDEIATRNQIQHAILGRSTSLCNEFKQGPVRTALRRQGRLRGHRGAVARTRL